MSNVVQFDESIKPEVKEAWDKYFEDNKYLKTAKTIRSIAAFWIERGIKPEEALKMQKIW